MNPRHAVKDASSAAGCRNLQTTARAARGPLDDARNISAAIATLALSHVSREWIAAQLGRAPWLRANTPAVAVLPKRPSFTGKGTDSTDYAWMVWGCGAPSVYILDTSEAA